MRQFLGGVPIDHFVEVTMVAFYQIAQNVQPIQVCVKEDTQDTFSGANFHAGLQEINASQAMAFVRQRRDTVHPDLQFTDLDRSRRQQAFIASLFHQLKQANTFINPATITGLVNVAKQNTAIDAGLDPIGLARDASAISGGNLHFFTLPVERFGFDSRGQSVNFVDVPADPQHGARDPEHRQCADGTSDTEALGDDDAPCLTARSTSSTSPGSAGQARLVLDAAVAKGYRAGLVSSGVPRTGSVVDYAPGDSAAAQSLAGLLGGLEIRERASDADGLAHRPPRQRVHAPGLGDPLGHRRDDPCAAPGDCRVRGGRRSVRAAPDGSDRPVRWRDPLREVGRRRGRGGPSSWWMQPVISREAGLRRRVGWPRWATRPAPRGAAPAGRRRPSRPRRRCPRGPAPA